MLRLRPSTTARRHHCSCCGKHQITVWGTVAKDDVGHAVYYAYMHPEEAGHPERMCSLTICIGDWATDATPPNRDWIQLKVRYDFQMMVREAQEAILFGRELLGRPMTREQALKSPLLPQFFEVADVVVLNDPAVHSFLSGKPIDLGVRQLDPD